MIRLKLNAPDEEILKVIEAWTELLVTDRYDEAFLQTLHRADVGWTADLMRTLVSNYGAVEPCRDGRIYHVTSPSQPPAGDRYFFGVERYGDDPNRPQEYVGAALYNLPLNGEWSDLSAMFDLVVVDGALLLSLDGIHVL